MFFMENKEEEKLPSISWFDLQRYKLLHNYLYSAIAREVMNKEGIASDDMGNLKITIVEFNLNEHISGNTINVEYVDGHPLYYKHSDHKEVKYCTLKWEDICKTYIDPLTRNTERLFNDQIDNSIYRLTLSSNSMTYPQDFHKMMHWMKGGGLSHQTLSFIDRVKSLVETLNKLPTFFNSENSIRRLLKHSDPEVREVANELATAYEILKDLKYKIY